MTEQFTMTTLLIVLDCPLRRISHIRAVDSQVIATLVLNIALPSLVIINLNSTELKLSLSILSILMIIYGIMAKMVAVWSFREYDNHMRGSVGMMISAMNIGLFIYPLIETIWPRTGLIYFGTADIGGAFVILEITYFIDSYFGEGGDQFDFKYLGRKLLQSVLLVAYIIVFILNIGHIHLPHVAIGLFSILLHANMPLLTILLSVMLSFTLERKYVPTIVKYLCLRYGLALITGLLVHMLLSVSDSMIKTTLSVTWMFPVGVAIISYGIQLKYRALPFTGMTTNLAIIISIITPYVYQAVFV